ncbi:MAG: membrane protein insertase YidC [Planctomycetes bacterium]|nr:membrane protein insertase YidC [Planctomycetota bacterium]
MERRYVTFFAISLAIVIASQVLQSRFFPAPPPPPPNEAEPAADAVESRPDEARPAADEVAMSATAGEPVARRRFTLGSLDPADPARLLATLSSRGGTIERIELSDGQFHDQDDRSGYLGHLVPVADDAGCRLGVVGAGTPAAAAGLRVDDVIVRVAGAMTADPAALADVLAGTRPGQRVTIAFQRDGVTADCEATLGRRPLEVVRPEFKGEPVADVDARSHDQLSFLLSIESRDGRRRREPLDEIEGQGLATIDWEGAATADGRGVRFTRSLSGGLRIAKEYRLAEAGPDATGYALELLVEMEATDTPTVVSYALDGPTGLPTEGWWYTQRVWHDFWSSLAVRDVALRFAGGTSTLISGLKALDGTLERPATTIADGTPLAFAGVDALYFASALIPATDADPPALAEVRPLVVGKPPSQPRKKLVDVTARLVSADLSLEPGRPLRHRFTIFAGPKQPELLRRFGAAQAGMDDLVYYGWFGWVARPMIAVLHGLHAVVGNYGVAIILLTVLVRGAMFPVSRRQAISSQKMQALQPEMKVLNEKYKKDPERRTRATQELWRKHGVNPASGCLPVFIQIPIFMGLYRALATDVSLREAPLFSSAIRWCSNLAAPDMFWNWSAILPRFFSDPEGWLGPYLNLLPLATIGLFLWQQKLFMPPALDEQQKMQQQVMNYMMWFMALMFFKVPSGLCLYFIASSLWGIAERLLWLPKATAQVAGDRTLAVATPPGGPTAAEATREKRLARKRR